MSNVSREEYFPVLVPAVHKGAIVPCDCWLWMETNQKFILYLKKNQPVPITKLTRLLKKTEEPELFIKTNDLQDYTIFLDTFFQSSTGVEVLQTLVDEKGTVYLEGIPTTLSVKKYLPTKFGKIMVQDTAQKSVTAFLKSKTHEIEATNQLTEHEQQTETKIRKSLVQAAAHVKEIKKGLEVGADVSTHVTGVKNEMGVVKSEISTASERLKMALEKEMAHFENKYQEFIDPVTLQPKSDLAKQKTKEFSSQLDKAQNRMQDLKQILLEQVVESLRDSLPVPEPDKRLAPIVSLAKRQKGIIAKLKEMVLRLQQELQMRKKQIQDLLAAKNVAQDVQNSVGESLDQLSASTDGVSAEVKDLAKLDQQMTSVLPADSAGIQRSDPEPSEVFKAAESSAKPLPESSESSQVHPQTASQVLPQSAPQGQGSSTAIPSIANDFSSTDNSRVQIIELEKKVTSLSNDLEKERTQKERLSEVSKELKAKLDAMVAEQAEKQKSGRENERSLSQLENQLKAEEQRREKAEKLVQALKETEKELMLTVSKLKQSK